MLIYAMACASAFVPSPNALTQQRFAQSSIAMQSTAPPSEAIWNEQIKAAWTKAYQTATCPPADYAIEDIVGKIPEALSGTIFRNGPGNFERGSKRYKHVLDGDGLLCRFSLDGKTNRARFAAKFVQTPWLDEELEANDILFRNTFGTQPEGGWLSNVGKIALKNPANTHVIVGMGDKCLALWEAAPPCKIDPKTLDYVGVETFDGQGDLPASGLTVTTGVAALDRAIGAGRAFTAHPREDRKRGRMVGWSWAAPLVGDSLSAKIHEWDMATGELLHTTETKLPSPVAPHDFALTDNWYIYVLNAMELKLAPFILGLTGPVGALCTTGQGVKLRLVPRPDGNAAGRRPLTVTTNDPYFAIHHATAFEEAAVSPNAAPMLRLITAAWPRVGEGPFLGDWGGDVPMYDDGKINPTKLLQTTIRLFEDGASVERSTPMGACIDHPHVDPRFDGDAAVRYVYMSYCNEEGDSGSPPIGWARWDRQTGEKEVWLAPPNHFCEEVVVIPRPGKEEATQDEADCWVAAMMFNADAGKSCLCILDGDNFAAGPVAQLWLKSFIPHGLHGCYTPEMFGLL